MKKKTAAEHSAALLPEERLRQYAEIVRAVASRRDLNAAGDVAFLTAPEARVTVSAGSEVEPQTHLTTEYDQ